jgi:NCS1 nucleoside transporter family
LSLDVESHGIDAVPAGSRDRGWFALFAMYAGINICLPMMLVGGILVPGLSFSQAILVGILGNALAAGFICLAAYPGADHGLPAAVLTRVFLGYPWGTWIASLAATFSLLGWYAVQAELAGLAADGLAQKFLGASSPVTAIALMGGLNVFFAVMGFGWIQKLATYSVPALLAMSALLFLQLARDYPFSELVSRPGNGGMSFLTGINVMVSGQIAASFNSSDLSRYARDHRSVWVGILSGVAPISTFMIGLGALSALASGEWNPVLGVQQLGLGVPALLLIIFATWTTNDKNLYSGGLALTNILPGQARWQHTLVLGVLGTALGCFRLTRYFTGWLITLGAVFAPLVGILLADYFAVRRRKPRVDEVYRLRGSYRYAGGVNIAAILSMAVGVVAGRLAPPESIQPLVSLLAAGTFYGVAMRLFYPAQFRDGARA